MFRFTIRDLLWLMVVAALGLGCWMDNKRIEKHVTTLESDSHLLHLEYESRLKSLDEIFLPGTGTAPSSSHPTTTSPPTPK